MPAVRAEVEMRMKLDMASGASHNLSALRPVVRRVFPFVHRMRSLLLVRWMRLVMRLLLLLGESVLQQYLEESYENEYRTYEYKE